MIGHRSIVALRKARRKPAAVFVTIGNPPAGPKGWSPEHEIGAGSFPEVYTQADDPDHADLRFLHGVGRVHLSQGSGSREAWWAWWDRIVEAKPQQVVGVEPDGEVVTWPQ